MKKPKPEIEIRTVRLDKIAADHGVRRTAGTEKASIRGLADDITAHGLFHFPLVAPESDGTYRVVSGRRRIAAVRLLGWKEIPVRFYSTNSPELLDLIENMQRVDLSDHDKALAFKKLVDSRQFSQVALAHELDLDKSTVSRMIGFARLIESGEKLHGDKVSWTKPATTYWELEKTPELLLLVEAENWTQQEARAQAKDFLTNNKEAMVRKDQVITPESKSAKPVRGADHGRQSAKLIHFLKNDEGFEIPRFKYKRGPKIDYALEIEKIRDLVAGLEHALTIIVKHSAEIDGDNCQAADDTAGVKHHQTMRQKKWN